MKNKSKEICLLAVTVWHVLVPYDMLSSQEEGGYVYMRSQAKVNSSYYMFIDVKMGIVGSDCYVEENRLIGVLTLTLHSAVTLRVYFLLSNYYLFWFCSSFSSSSFSSSFLCLSFSSFKYKYKIISLTGVRVKSDEGYFRS